MRGRGHGTDRASSCDALRNRPPSDGKGPTVILTSRHRALDRGLESLADRAGGAEDIDLELEGLAILGVEVPIHRPAGVFEHFLGAFEIEGVDLFAP